MRRDPVALTFDYLTTYKKKRSRMHASYSSPLKWIAVKIDLWTGAQHVMGACMGSLRQHTKASSLLVSCNPE